MTRNQHWMEKADLALADLASSGGLLNPEQANTFIRKLIKAPTILNVLRVVEMNASQRKVNKIQFASRILRPGTQGTALTQSERSKVTTEQIQLNTKEVIAEVRIPYDVIEDNIERGSIGQDSDGGAGTPAGGGFVATMLTLIAERAALDLEELGIKGDLLSTDDYLALTDGFLKTAEDNGNIANALGATVSKTMFKAGLKTMPDQYKRNLSAMFHMLSRNNEIEYRDFLANRATGLGDATIQGFNAVFGFGVPLLGVDLMPVDKGLLCQPLNLLMGIQRQVMLEFDKDITTRVYIIVLTARIDFQIEESDAVVVYNNIATA